MIVNFGWWVWWVQSSGLGIQSFSVQIVFWGCDFGGQDPREKTDVRILQKPNPER